MIFQYNYKKRIIGKETIFEIQLEFNDEELKDFNKQLGTRILTKELLMKIKIGPDNIPNIVFPKKGTSVLTKKKREVLNFLAGKVSYNYIPSIRTKRTAINLIRENVAKELKSLKENPKYNQALETIRKLQKEILEEISLNVKGELGEFLPKVNNVEITIDDDSDLGISVRNINVFVNDGIKTSIEDKGDGVNSLAVLAILKNRKNKGIDSYCIAIDEPEAHLHPGAITELSNNLKSISEDDQVIISTHNATFIDINNISNNIIIDSGKAIPAKNVSEVRNILGIVVEDYMIASRFSLLVEGESDEKILYKLLSEKSQRIKKALQERELVIKSIDSATKLNYHLHLLKDEICKPLVLLDDDSSGKAAITKALEQKLIGQMDYCLLNCRGMNESEIEDIIKPEIYYKFIKDNYGVNLDVQLFKSKKKWSDRITEVFQYNGKIINEHILKEIKVAVVALVLDSPAPFIEARLNGINSLTDRIIELLK